VSTISYEFFSSSSSSDHHNNRRPLRSAAVRTHASFHGRTIISFGDRSFSAAGPRVHVDWNSLPPHLRQDTNFARFQHKLNTFLFGCWSTKAHRDCLQFCAEEILLLTYLLNPSFLRRREGTHFLRRHCCITSTAA